MGGIPTERFLELQKHIQGLAEVTTTDSLLKTAVDKALALVPADEVILLLYSSSQEIFFLQMTSQQEGTYASPCHWRPGELGPEV